MALHFADLAGLGLIAAPVVHDVFAKDPEEISPEAKRFKHLSDLAGVGILAGTTGYKAHQLAQALKAGTTLVPKH
jgi:hypothetical protein